ncbi:aldo/keto reductase [Hoeflea sp. TYP-13]|uniref:aldo/keto reductase n=1 Tax=Hoeflea sp. TYP-13 TaxID=3230023 RepID=UPI0034C61410
MDYRFLGRTGVRVSSLCLGTMSFGGEADAEAASALYRASRDAGINFFDCANVYNAGRSEEILGTLIKGERDDLVITSKCFFPAGSDINARGASRRHIVKAAEDSLKRLGTDRLDVLFIHRWDKNTPLEETLRALEDLVRAGKVLYLGASNFAAWQVAKALGVSERKGWTRFEVLQPMYNLVKRQAEVEILPMAESEQLGVISYSPVGGGLLSGKYASGREDGTGRITDNDVYSVRYGEDWVFETARQFADLAIAEGHHPVSLAVAWVRAHPGITAPIIGARNVDQLKPSLEAANIYMTPELYARIATLSRTPPPATDRLEEAGNG